MSDLEKKHSTFVRLISSSKPQFHNYKALFGLIHMLLSCNRFNFLGFWAYIYSIIVTDLVEVYD